MTIWVSVLRRKLKDYNFLFMMSLFPIFLTLIFVNMFTTVQELDQKVSLKVLIDEPVATIRGQEMKEYFTSLEDMMDIQIIDSAEENIDFIVHIDEKEKEIEVENKDGNILEKGVLYNLLQDFSNQYALRDMVGDKPIIPVELEVEAVEGNKQEDITPPLVVTMLIFGILLGGNYGIKQVFYMSQPAGIRTFTAPISKGQLYTIEFVTSTLVIAFVGVLAAISYEVLFDVKFSRNVLLSIGMIMIMSMLATLLGMTLGVNVKSQDTAENILSLVITFSAVLSGKLMPILDLGKVTAFSPVKYVAQALEDIVTKGQIISYGPLCLTLFICFALLIALSLWGLGRKGQL